MMDKHLRLHLRSRSGETISVEPFECPEAIEIQVSAPFAWTSPEGGRIIHSLLNDRPVCQQQKIPVYTLTGSIIMVEVEKTNPDCIVLITDETAVNVERQLEKEQAAGITYQDIGGLGQEIQRVRELVEFPLRSPESFAKLGIEPPRGIILYGPPGTGKTLIAKALSNEVGSQFFLIQGPEIMSSYYGASEQKLREIFDKARQSAPAVILMDELDAISVKREQTRGDLEQRVVATLLSLMDGLTDLGEVLVIGTTNRLNAIDPALRRPGRFEHEIHIGVPDLASRNEILAIHTRRMPLADDVDLQYLAEKTPGFVGADLAALCREAGYSTIRR
ncbi:MAG: AAA family ATPase, partial [Chloroflexi bacterium]|nr:AAA family ATPase [Chloroflexota bacterium]